MPQRRVLFTGQTGIGYRQAIENVAKLIAKRYDLPEEIDSAKTREFIYVANLEEKLKERGADFPLILDSYAPKVLRQIAKDAFLSILEDIESKRPRVVLLSLHATMFRNGMFHSTQVLDLVQKYAPDLGVTFIDDVYVIWKRIVDRNLRNPSNSYLRLRDIMVWRSVEILTADMLAKLAVVNAKGYDIEQKNIVLAAKHPVETLYRIIMEPWRLIVYASFPISKTRDDPQRRQEIDEYRKRLTEKYIVLDPLTIDERILEFALERTPSVEEYVCLDGSERWPLEASGCLVAESASNYPIKFPRDEVMEVAGAKPPPDYETDIGKQIQWRDFRLIRQCDVLAAYRPYKWEKTGSTGVLSEISHAATIPRRMIVLHPDEDEADTKSPFGTRGVSRCSRLNDMLAIMEKWAEPKREAYLKAK
jgi:hypothetical protein